MPDESLSPLGGEADPNTWHFSADHGPLPNPVGHTFPLLTHDREGRWRLLGTGFYIRSDGLFVTAKHVLIDDVLEGYRQIAPLAIFHLYSESGLFGPQELLVRPVGQCWLGDHADIVLGEAAVATNNATGQVLSHWAWPLSWSPPVIGAMAATYAFSNHSVTESGGRQTIHFRPDLYRGTIRSAGACRDKVMVPYPFLEVDFRIHGAASGGPIIGQDGRTVIGVNCTGFDLGSGSTVIGDNELGPVGFGAQIRCLQDAFLSATLLPGESHPRRLTFAELVEQAVVTAHHFTPSSVPPQPGRIVRLDAVRITVPTPQLIVDTMS